MYHRHRVMVFAQHFLYFYGQSERTSKRKPGSLYIYVVFRAVKTLSHTVAAVHEHFYRVSSAGKFLYSVLNDL